ncbi:hypothetical protein [Roseiconus lacunae]|uniref:hypothetical protein n=1 Tax=Roseiconus lacunae TaxID=2605694 RepID=UPI001E5F5F25|nr:hypothetical protein [Roseiconus lacunae]MCD0459575.1 hypothetical protein [Roseiconus lacunae]
MTLVESVVNWVQNCEFVAGTPKKISPEILGFCKTLGADAPGFLTITPTDEAESSLCAHNVDIEVDKGNGLLQAGWTIWQMENAYLVAERHAVLRTRNGLVDITPQADGARRSLFAPTSEVPESFAIPCRYLPLVDHPLIHSATGLLEWNSQLFYEGLFRCPDYLINDRRIASSLRKYFDIQKRRQGAKQESQRKKRRKAERQRKKQARLRARG